LISEFDEVPKFSTTSMKHKIKNPESQASQENAKKREQKNELKIEIKKN